MLITYRHMLSSLHVTHYMNMLSLPILHQVENECIKLASGILGLGRKRVFREHRVSTWNVHLQSAERLTAVSIMGAQLRDPLKPQDMIGPMGFRGTLNLIQERIYTSGSFLIIANCYQNSHLRST